MKIQSLAVIFIIIILPISIVLSSYINNQTKTLELQLSYDSKLNNATYDALKAFQLNTINSSTSDLSNSKLRDIEASANTFFNSISSNFNMAGYNKDVLKDFVPALVYTMYDGYYIYSPYTNTLEPEDYYDSTNPKTLPASAPQNPESSTYVNDEIISGLKPYIHYSCRYRYGGNDFTITYSLDNYITIQGIVNGTNVFDYGYVINPADVVIGGVYDPNDDDTIETTTVTYRGKNISNSEQLEEYTEFSNVKYPYVKINGVKYYQEQQGTDAGKWFSMLNGKKYYEQNRTYKLQDYSAKRYYIEAKEFTQRLIGYGLNNLRMSNAVEQTSNTNFEQLYPTDTRYVFADIDNNPMEDMERQNSNFNQHRLKIIRHSIEKNLSIAIANYNNYFDNHDPALRFQMPKLKEDEWDKILNNVSIISFLQGLSIGGKIYNGYSIVTNDKTEEVITENSIYITSNTNDNENYYKTFAPGLYNNISSITNPIGVFNIDFERKKANSEDAIKQYFFPKVQQGDYVSIVESRIDDTYNGDIYTYLDNKDNLASVYYTALGRERYSMYKTNNNPDELKEKYYD